MTRVAPSPGWPILACNSRSALAAFDVNLSFETTMTSQGVPPTITRPGGVESRAERSARPPGVVGDETHVNISVPFGKTLSTWKCFSSGYHSAVVQRGKTKTNFVFAGEVMKSSIALDMLRYHRQCQLAGR